MLALQFTNDQIIRICFVLKERLNWVNEVDHKKLIRNFNDLIEDEVLKGLKTISVSNHEVMLILEAFELQMVAYQLSEEIDHHIVNFIKTQIERYDRETKPEDNFQLLDGFS